MIRPTAHGSEPPLLVGRSRERDLIHSQLGAALAGRGGLVILSGDAGIGKTTLAEDTCREASVAGALVLVGRCYDRAETFPYGPWRDLLEEFRALPDRSPALRAITEPRLTRSPSQATLFDEVRRFLVAIARERPLVILLDDLHWADSASLDLLRFVARDLMAVPLLLLVTYRGDEVTRQHPLYRLLPLLVREALAVRIDLSPLGIDDVRTLIDHAYQLPPGDARHLAAYLQARAEGNPLFLGELLRSLQETALVRTTTGGWMLGALAQIKIPVLLRQVIDARLARFGQEGIRHLAMGAVIGQVVPLSLWATVVATTEGALLPLVEQAIEARILDATPDGLAVRFAHALIREALYEGVLPPRRRGWHRQIGEALLVQARAPDPDVVAYHFSQAGDPRAAVWLTRAGERAQRSFAWQTAISRFEAALALLAADDTALNERGWLIFRLALLRRFENPTGGAVALERAEHLGSASSDAALVAYARFYRGVLHNIANHVRQGIATAEAGVALLDALAEGDRRRLAAIDTSSDPLDAQNGRGELTLELAVGGRFARARALGEQIISLPPAETFGSRGDAQYGLGFAYAALGQPAAARRAFTIAREIFRDLDYRIMAMATLFDELMVVILPYQIDQPSERQQVEAELGQAFATLGAIFEPRAARLAAVVSLALTGAWDEVFAILEQSGPRMMRLLSATLLAPLARHRGNAALAWTLVHEGLPAGPETPPEDSVSYILPLRVLAVTLALDADDHDAARQWLVSLDRWLAWSGSILGRADAHLGWATYYRSMGDSARARARAMQALHAAGAPRQPLALLAAHRLLGELDLMARRLLEAETRLMAALALAEACGAQYERALTLLALAEARRARGDLPAARAHLDTVRALCAPMGAALALARADALAERLPALLADPPPPRLAGLTAREAEVLRQVATGLSNAEIAHQLSLSPRTVNAHLTNIYGKLGVATRGAAIRVALDHGLR